MNNTQIIVVQNKSSALCTNYTARRETACSLIMVVVTLQKAGYEVNSLPSHDAFFLSLHLESVVVDGGV